MWRYIKQALIVNIVLMLIVGLAYPLAMTALAQVCFPNQANGSLVTQNGQEIGSKLIGQQFVSPRYFHGRPSAAGKGYDASASGGSNLGPTNKQLIGRVRGDIARAKTENPTAGKIPADMVTTSGSGLDPEISPANAIWQIPRVAKARGISATKLRQLVDAHTQGRTFGILGEPRVNVLELNLALDSIQTNH